MYDVDDNMFVVDAAIKHNSGTKEEIELYEELSLALELMQDDSFEIINSQINNGIDFNIITKYPNGLPFNIASMFFNVSKNFNVSIKETSQYVYNMERYFQIKLKKV